jgi:acyl dehydratase
MESPESPRFLSYGDLAEGMASERTYIISPAVYQSFLSAFGDRSPIHVDPEYARARGFAGTVMHGAILSGFVSHFIGMVFPGANSLILSTELRFSQPSYLGDTLLLRGTVAQKVDAQEVALLHMTLFNQTRGLMAATGRVQVRVRGT